MRIGGYLVPKGTILNVPFDAVHHFPGNWPQDTDAFIPVCSFSATPSLSCPQRSCLTLSHVLKNMLSGLGSA